MDDIAPPIEPAPEEETAAQAFARLDGRIAMMARAVEHLAAERASIDIPDYSATLGQMNSRLAAAAQALAEIVGKPAMQMTPEALAARMNAAAEKSRATDRTTLREAREGHEEATRTIRGLVGVMQGVKEQRRRLTWAAGAGLLAGCILWSILPGAVLRVFPVGWHLPESMAVHIIGEPNLWDAGARMMKVGDPEAWRTILSADNMRRENLDTITACERAAAKTGKPERCSILIDGQDR